MTPIFFSCEETLPLAPEDITRQILDLTKWPDFHGYGPIPGIQTAVFPFTTDVAFLDRWGAPLLFGPGSIRVAHTAEEHVEIQEMEEAIEQYVRIAGECLRQVNGASA